ncbi:hypothetical protein [Burkholderia multivorans]|uniref:hypothetical protein n=1 Tax=Burkholderia multivorans TaxID=87883 RepID=UPI0011B1DE53|nr:hypothetical protein [Burkholderia multivorans]MBU9399552.1 hypothetical protein [Burkholderia multivorans]
MLIDDDLLDDVEWLVFVIVIRPTRDSNDAAVPAPYLTRLGTQTYARSSLPIGLSLTYGAAKSASKVPFQERTRIEVV